MNRCLREIRGERQYETVRQYCERINAHTERTIQVRNDVVEITNGDIPIESSRGKIAAIWGESNRPNLLAVLDDWANLSEC